MNKFVYVLHALNSEYVSERVYEDSVIHVLDLFFSADVVDDEELEIAIDRLCVKLNTPRSR